MEQTRVDRWLWAVRLCRTRSEAAEACRAGHVRVDGRSAKPATPVSVGRRVEARLHGRDRVVEVAKVIEKRVGAALAAECFTDQSPPAPSRDRVGPAGVRDRGAGRPTKRERRHLDRLRGDGAPDLPSVAIFGDEEPDG